MTRGRHGRGARGDRRRCSGRPTSDRAERPGGPRRPRDARDSGRACSRRLHALQAAAWLDQRGRPELHLRAARGAAGRGVRRGDVLRDVQRAAPAEDRRARLRRPRVPDQRREGAPRPSSRRRAPRATGRGRRARASGCASRRPRSSRSSRGARTWRSAARRSATVRAVAAPGAESRVRGPITAPQTWDPGARASLRLLARVGAGRSDARSTTTARWAGTRRCGARWNSDPTRRSGRSPTLSSSAAAAPRSPPGSKWKAVAEQSVRPHFVICNADESEPGTFKDRLVMELDPFAVSRRSRSPASRRAPNGATSTSAVSTRSPRNGWRHAIDEARRPRASSAMTSMEHGFAFDVELRRGAGAYICGEETALFNSIEGKRGEPRNKPPFPVTSRRVRQADGDQQRGDAAQRAPDPDARRGAYASDRHRGLDGHAAVLPVAATSSCRACTSTRIGVTLGEAIDAAGGVRGGGAFKAVLLGGAAGGFVGPDRLDARLTFEDARAGGYTLGSGVIMVFDEDTDLVDLCVRIARFFRDESCGQCVPAGSGPFGRKRRCTDWSAAGRWARPADELALLEDVAAVMRDASICGLGQTAAERGAVGDLDVRAVRRGPRRERGSRSRRRGRLAGRRGRRSGGPRPGWVHDPRRLPRGAHRHAHDVLRGQPHPDERLPGVRGRGRGRTDAGALLLPTGRAGMKVRTDTDRVRHSRRLVMEFLASSVDTTLTSPDWHRWQDEYASQPGPVRCADGADGGR